MYCVMHFMGKKLKQRWKWATLGILIGILIFTLTGFLAAPVFIKSIVIRKLSEGLQREVLIQGVKVNPYFPSLKIHNLVIKDNDGKTFVSFNELFIHVRLFSLLKRAFVFKKLYLKQPYIRVVRNGETRFDFSNLTSGKSKGTPLLRFSFHDAKIIDGKVFAEEKDAFLILPEVSVYDADINITRQEISVKKISTSNGSLRVRRSPDGTFNFHTIIPPAKQPEQPVRRQQPWQVTIKDFRIKEFTTQYEDLAMVNPVAITLDHINLHARGLTTQKGKKGRISFSSQWNKGGMVTAKGGIQLNPLITVLKTSAREVDISPLQPYGIKNQDLAITRANFHADGRLTLDYRKRRKSMMRFRGESSLSGFRSIDQPSQHDFLAWSTFLLSGADIRYNPTKIHAEGAFLDNFVANVLVHSDGTSDLQMLLTQGTDGDGQPLKQEAEAPESYKEFIPPIKIDTVSFQNGQVNFIDRYIDPHFKSELRDIRLKVSGLSTEEIKPAHIFLTGEIEGIFPLEITGKVNLLPEGTYANVNVVVRGYDLPFLTPYAGKYLGYTIEKGKLYLDLKYEVSENKLDGENQIVLDQFSLGEKVESPQATSLPVRFVTNFLKDREGKIKINLPVSGDVSDPHFGFGETIFRSIVNLVTKVAASPFAMLGNIFGGGGELNYLEFDHGTSWLDEKNMQKLNDLIVALYEHPYLRLEIEGGVDPENDREALALCRFIDLIKTQKLNDMVKRGGPAVPLREVKIHVDEYEKYLKKAYMAADFPKPRNIFGLVKDIPAQEMKKLLMYHIEITDDDLRSLAQARANVVRDYILKSEKLDPGRIFIIEPKIYPAGEDEKGKKSHVQFALR